MHNAIAQPDNILPSSLVHKVRLGNIPGIVYGYDYATGARQSAWHITDKDRSGHNHTLLITNIHACKHRYSLVHGYSVVQSHDLRCRLPQGVCVARTGQGPRERLLGL